MSGHVQPGKKPSFNPTMSFDGVAIIIGIIMLSAWMGRLDNRVTTNSENIKSNSEQIRELIKITGSLQGRNQRPQGPPPWSN